MKQRSNLYKIHKYWGKKPAGDLRALIEHYSEEGDTVLDPFAGYGVFGCEAFLLNRNVVLNDLNPFAHFLHQQLLARDVSLDVLQSQWVKIKAELSPYIDRWYQWDINGERHTLTTILRARDDVPIKARYVCATQSKRALEIDLCQDAAERYLAFEAREVIEDWYPTDELIQNSRISAKSGMCVCDLFTKRTLACHARLFALIHTYSSGRELDLFKVAFTANLANCSKLVPPIKSRGPMSPGAWMTGFYIGETYLENNVALYFVNRLKKLIKGKAEFLSHFESDRALKASENTRQNHFIALQDDAKSLSLDDDSVDFVFADPPYGDTVPYFEQSIIWNSWLSFRPDYEREIVITDSKMRAQDQARYDVDIHSAFAEVSRVLKKDRVFSLTYHSLSGLEWRSITNACLFNGFELIDFQWLVQKSFTPRQINRLKSVKGDVLVTFKNTKTQPSLTAMTDREVEALFIAKITQWVTEESVDLNEILLRVMKTVFTEKIIISDLNVLRVVTRNFQVLDDQTWALR